MNPVLEWALRDALGSLLLVAVYFIGKKSGKRGVARGLTPLIDAIYQHRNLVWEKGDNDLEDSVEKLHAAVKSLVKDLL